MSTRRRAACTPAVWSERERRGVEVTVVGSVTVLRCAHGSRVAFVARASCGALSLSALRSPLRERRNRHSSDCCIAAADHATLPAQITHRFEQLPPTAAAHPRLHHAACPRTRRSSRSTPSTEQRRSTHPAVRAGGETTTEESRCSSRVCALLSLSLSLSVVQLSAGLSSALADDVSYQQMNDAKLRGVSAMVGWDQFHGMVLTAHLKPVNLRAEPIDEMARGIPRAKKLEKERARGMDQCASGVAGKEGMSAQQEEDNREFLRALDLQLPSNAHELARDWKRLVADPASSSSLDQIRYRYLLTLPLRSSTQLLKGGLPLDIIAQIFEAIHAQWTHADDSEAPAAEQAQPASAAAESASAVSDPAGSDPAAAASITLPSPVAVCHVLLLLHHLSSMSSFSIALFSLTTDDKHRLSDILALATEAIANPSWVEWQQRREQAEKEAAAVDAAAAGVAAVSVSAASSPAAVASTPASASTAAPAPVRTDLDHSKARGNMLLSGPNGPAPRAAAAAAPAKAAAAAAPVQFDQALVEKLRAKYKLPSD